MATTAVHGAVGTVAAAPSRLCRARYNPPHRTSRPQQHHGVSRHLLLRSSRSKTSGVGGAAAMNDDDLAAPAATEEHELVLGMG